MLRMGHHAQTHDADRADARRAARVRKTTLNYEAGFELSRGVPQNLHYAPLSDNLWSLDEMEAYHRPVYAMKLSDLWN